jgi:hypothetical protein
MLFPVSIVQQLLTSVHIGSPLMIPFSFRRLGTKYGRLLSNQFKDQHVKEEGTVRESVGQPSHHELFFMYYGSLPSEAPPSLVGTTYID